MTSTEHDLVLNEVLAALEAGKKVDVDALRAAFPDHADTISQLVHAISKYDEAVDHAIERQSAKRRIFDEGDVVEGFEIQGLLGSGGEGQVYLARQSSLGGRAVALKVLGEDRTSDTAQKRFEREANTLADLHHPHLAEVYGFGEADGRRYIAMQYVPGPSLGELQRRIQDERGPGRVALRRTLVRFVAQVSDALALLHAEGVVHRDVKPSNVMLDKPVGDLDELLDEHRFKAILVDFGLAKPVEPDVTVTLTGEAAGTVKYAPPEQLAGRVVGPDADVFALGATLHDLVSGRLSADRRQASAGLEPLELLVPEAVDEDLFAVVAKATRESEHPPYEDAEALRDDLWAWLEGAAVSARALTSADRLQRWVKRHGWHIAAVVSTAALIFAAATWFRIQIGNAKRAEEAYARAEFLSLAGSIGEVPPWLLELTDRGELADLRASLVTGHGAQVGLSRLIEYLQRDDPFGAVSELGRELANSNGPLDPVLESYLLSSLRDEDDARRAAALRTAIRLLNEEDWTRWGEPSISRWRATLRGILSESATENDDLVFAAAGLGLCGDASDAFRLLDLCRDPYGATTAFGTQLILGATQTLNRLRYASEPIDLQRLDREVGRVLSTVSHSLLTYADPHSGARRVYDLFVELQHWHRAAGTAGSLPRRDAELALEQARSHNAGMLARLAFCTNDPLLEEADFASADSFYLGFASYFRDPKWQADPRRENDKRFRDGGNYAERTGTRLVPSAPLDVETRYDFLWGEERRAYHTASQRPGEASIAVESPLSPPRAFAQWDFRPNTPVLRDNAIEWWARGGSLDGQKDSRFAVLQDFERGELEFEFQVFAEDLAYKAPGGFPLWEFEVIVLAASRAYVPFGGEAFVDLELDGRRIESGRRIIQRHVRPLRWVFGTEGLEPGKHRLVVRLVRPTTTTFRVYVATLSSLRAR